MLQILFALLAGVLTIAAPCILPLLPIILGSSVGQQNKTRPLFIVLGFVLSFALASFFLSVLVLSFGLSPNSLRNIAIVLLAVFAMFMIWPKPFEILTAKMNGFVNRANQVGQSKSGNFGAFFLGLVLGVIWTPCAGPVLGSILTLIATQGSAGKSAVLLIAYAIGAGIPMLLIAYLGQIATTMVRSISKYSVRLQQFFGVLILLLAIAMYFQYDTKIQAAIVDYFPSTNLENSLIAKNGNPIIPQNNKPMPTDSAPFYNATQGEIQNTKGVTMEKIKLDNFGQAPEFTGISHWLNSDPLTIKSLKGKVVLVDFWTYTCINCIRTLPYVTKWYDTYKDKGLVVIGVHTPEFPFEKVTENVATAIKRFNIHYPVAQDNDYGTWGVYNNQYWPAEYLIDQNGNIVHEHFGEGEYDKTEAAIVQLLGAEKSAEIGNGLKPFPTGDIKSPEMYFGTNRLQNLSVDQSVSLQPTTYNLPPNLALNRFALDGTWQFDGEKARLISATGKIKLHFSSGKIFMVATSTDKPIILKIFVDGISQPDVSVGMSQLYTLFNSTDYREHEIEIIITSSGFEAFTFTFG